MTHVSAIFLEYHAILIPTGIQTLNREFRTVKNNVILLTHLTVDLVKL
jgi:hypothetical protein